MPLTWFILPAALLTCAGPVSAFDFDEVTRSFARDFNRTDATQMKGRFETMIKGISGMEPGKNVQIVSKSRGDVKQEYYLLDVKRQNLEDESRFAAYEYLLKQFRLIDETSSLKDALLESQYDAIYGFYDPSKKTLLIMQRITGGRAENILFHELVHAAQDATIDLTKYHDRHCRDIDASLAALALIEGQASAVQLLVGIEQNLKGRTTREVIGAILDRIGGDGYHPKTNEADFLEGIGFFPYAYGLRFVLRKYMEKSDFISMFDQVPVSTAAILHPEKPHDAETSIRAALERDKTALSRIADTRLVFDSTMGEYFIRQLFFSKSPKGDLKRMESAAAGWNGDMLFVLKSKGNSYFVWDTRWQSQEDADEFRKCYLEFTKARFPSTEGQTTGDFDLLLAGSRAGVYLKQQGDRVVLMEGKISPSEAKSVARLLGLP